MEEKMTSAEAYWNVFGSLLVRQINGDIEDFTISECHKKLIGKDKDGIEVYDMHITCKVIPKKCVKCVELNFTVLPTSSVEEEPFLKI